MVLTERRRAGSELYTLTRRIIIAHHGIVGLPSVVFKNDQIRNDDRCDWTGYVIVIRSFVLYARSISWLRVSAGWRATLFQCQSYGKERYRARIRHHHRQMNSEMAEMADTDFGTMPQQG